MRCYSVRQFCNSNGSNVIFKHFLYVTQATSFWSPDGTSLFYLLCEAETWKPWKWMNRKVILLQIAAFSLHPIWTLNSPFFMPLHSVLTTRFAVHPFANYLIILSPLQEIICGVLPWNSHSCLYSVSLCSFSILLLMLHVFPANMVHISIVWWHSSVIIFLQKVKASSLPLSCYGWSNHQDSV